MAANTIEYANLLKEHGVGSAPAQQYKAACKDDPIFLDRAAVLERLFSSKPQVLQKLSAAQAHADSAHTGAAAAME